MFKEHAHFDLAPVTVLTGTNSSGKSSLFKGLLLMRDNIFKKELWHELDYSGRGHRLGTFQQSCNYQSEKQEIKVSFQFDYSREYEVEPLIQHPEFPFFSLVKCNLTFLPKEKENGILRKLEIVADGERILDVEGNSEENYNGGRIYFNLPWFIQKLRNILTELPDGFPTKSPFSGKKGASQIPSSMDDMKPFFN